MDRPHRIDRLTATGVGLLTIEATDPSDLEDEADRVFADVASAQVSQPYISGIALGGGGGGAAWRATFVAAEALGPGLQASCFAARAHCWFARARIASELDRVCVNLLARIEAAYPSAKVYDTQISGGARDGEYLVAVLFQEDAASPPTRNVFDGENTGPLAVATDVATIVIPQTVSGGPDDQAAWSIQWSVSVAETGGAPPGQCVVRLTSDIAGTVQEYRFTPVNANDYLPFAGNYVATQPVGADETFAIELDPQGAQLQGQDMSLSAHMVVRPDEPT